MTDLNPLVAAVVALLPTNRDGRALISIDYGVGPRKDPVVWGDPTLLAAKITAAVLRAAAAGHFGDMDNYYQYDQIYGLADQVEASVKT